MDVIGAEMHMRIACLLTGAGIELAMGMDELGELAMGIELDGIELAMGMDELGIGASAGDDELSFRPHELSAPAATRPAPASASVLRFIGTPLRRCV